MISIIRQVTQEVVTKKKEEKNFNKREVKSHYLSGSEYIRAKLKDLAKDIHEDIVPLIEREDIVGYKEVSGKVIIDFDDDSKLEIKIGSPKNRYLYKQGKEILFDEEA